MNDNNINKDAIYFKSLTLENIFCFKDKQTIDFTGKDGQPAKWTVILGNNNTGKTTLLRCLVDLKPDIDSDFLPVDIIEQIGTGFYLSGGTWSTRVIRNSMKRCALRAELSLNNQKIDLHISNISNKKLASLSKISKAKVKNLMIEDYGINRNININNESTSLFSTMLESSNVEEWLIQTDYAVKNGKTKAKKQLVKIKQVLVNILPDVENFRFTTDDDLKSFVEVQTDYGWVRLTDLGYGYQSLLAWVIDLAKKMFDRYPESENPLEEPAIVLIDELDLHLHPEWQRKIIKWLSTHFPNVQFIATSHSPMVIQSADEVNVVLLEKEGDHVKISQPDIHNFQGWTVEEILTELMGLGKGIYSDAYLNLMRQFDEALDEDDYEKAESIYEALDKILHPSSSQRKLLRIQMAGLTPRLETV